VDAGDDQGDDDAYGEGYGYDPAIVLSRYFGYCQVLGRR
jgi:hypothetical protein